MKRNCGYYIRVVITVLLLAAPLTESFLLPFAMVRSGLHQVACTGFSRSTKLCAKNTNKNNKRIGGPRGAGRRGKPKKDGAADEASEMKTVTIPPPSKIRKQIIHLNRPGKKTMVPVRSVCTVEVDDVEWWENPDNDNPYGGRLWPSALAISEFLITLGNLEGYDVLEIGCGTGLVSILAADCGARVVASDVSPTAIKLCKVGWLETQKKRQKQELKRSKQKKEDEETSDDRLGESEIIKTGSLNTLQLDLFSKKGLPIISENSTNQEIVIATAMMYESKLAAVLARRAFEACSRGAWVIIGDDDTGEREGGRQMFTSELDQIEKEKGVAFDRTWTSSIVQNKSLNWKAKNVKTLHINAPKSASLIDSL